jgi:Peptidase inhibitor family I36
MRNDPYTRADWKSSPIVLVLAVLLMIVGLVLMAHGSAQGSTPVPPTACRHHHHRCAFQCPPANAQPGQIYSCPNKPDRAQTAAIDIPDFTCPTGSVCTFTETGLNGTGLNIPDAAIPSGTVFNLLDFNANHAQSVRNRGGNQLWVADYQNGNYLCIPNTDWANTNGSYGHAERSGAYTCSGGVPPPNLFANTMKEKNEKGYPLTRDSTLESRIAQELKVAQWLLGWQLDI